MSYRGIFPEQVFDAVTTGKHAEELIDGDARAADAGLGRDIFSGWIENSTVHFLILRLLQRVHAQPGAMV